MGAAMAIGLIWISGFLIGGAVAEHFQRRNIIQSAASSLAKHGASLRAASLADRREAVHAELRQATGRD